MDFENMTIAELEELRRVWTEDVEKLRANLRLLVKELGRRSVLEDAKKKLAAMSESQKQAMGQVLMATGIPSTTVIGEPKKKWWERLLG